jgi:SPW repeat
VPNGRSFCTSGVSIVAGIWLATAPVLFHYAQAIIRWNDTVAGLLLIVLAALRYTHPLHRFWMSWVTAFIGLWDRISLPPWLSAYYRASQRYDRRICSICRWRHQRQRPIREPMILHRLSKPELLSGTRIGQAGVDLENKISEGYSAITFPGAISSPDKASFQLL